MRTGPLHSASVLLSAIAVVGLLLVMIQTSRQASAESQAEPGATIVVNTTEDELNDDGDCSLREAIQSANTDSAVDACTAGSGDDTVQVPAGTYVFGLAGAGEDENATGDLDIKSSLALVGDGASTTILNGNQLDRVLHIHNGATAVIENLTIANGKAPDGAKSGCGEAPNDFCPGENGGGVLNQGTLKISHGEILSNTSGSGGGLDEWCVEIPSIIGADGGYGGGLYNEGLLVVEDTVLRGNSTGGGGTGTSSPEAIGGYGGGIANAGTLHLVGVVIEANWTGGGGGFSWCGGPEPYLGAKGGNGGGVFNAGTLSIEASEVISNTTGGDTSGRGGGIANIGTITLMTSTVSNNATADGASALSQHGRGFDAGDGGGIHNIGKLTVHASTVMANRTGSGGSSYSRETGSGGNGGGIFNQGVLVLHNSTVSGNRAGDGGRAGSFGQPGKGGDGGGLFNIGTIELYHCTIGGNRAGTSMGDADGQGGGIYQVGELRMKNTIVAQNSTESGGGADCAGPLSSAGFNLIGQGGVLAPLGDYGGPTWTQALYGRSPAIDAGSCTDIGGKPVTVDQRGAVRPYACDGSALANGGFGEGVTGWYTSTTGTETKAHALIGSDTEGFGPFRGEFGARLGGFENVYDTISQTVTIPTDGRLAYWWKASTYETLPGHDGFGALLEDANGQQVASLASHDDRDAGDTWQQEIVDVSAFAGQDLVLKFYCSNDAYYFTTFYVDEVCVYSTAAEAKCDIGAYEADADPFHHYDYLPAVQN